MKENKMYLKEIMLVLILYMSPIVYLSTIFISDSYINIIEKIFLILITIIFIFFNKAKFSKRSLFIIFFTVLFFMINTMLVSYKTYVLAIFINTIIILMPITLLVNNDLNYDQIIIFLKKFSRFFTLIMPVYIFLVLSGRIGYFEIGLLTHINVIAISFQIYKKNRKSEVWFILVVNLIICLIWGSRSIFVTNLLLVIIVMVFFNSEKNFKFYIKITGLILLGMIIYNNLIYLLVKLQNIMLNFDLRSRNLSLFIQQLSNNSNEIYLSGREAIYPIIVEYLRGANGLPGGVALARVLTNGNYYHAHNFILEMLLTFGTILGSIMILILIILMLRELFKKKKESHTYFALTLLIGFLLRSIFGTFFLQDLIFILGISSLYSYYLKLNESEGSFKK